MTVKTDLTDQLIVVLRNVTGLPGLDYERPPEPMHGGFWAELFSFSLANPPEGWPAELVARLMPDPGTARKETIVQSAVAAAGFPTPFVRASGGPDCGLGRAFMVMDRATGRPALKGLDGGVTPAAVARLLRQVPDLLAGSMARLHALDPDLVRGELEQVREVPVSLAGQLTRLGRFAAEFGRPDLVDAARWLADHRPAPSPDVICHGDLHPFNLLADGDRVTVLDWSTALLAPRAHDVGFTSLLLSEPPLRVPGWQRPLVADGRPGAGPQVRPRLRASDGYDDRARRAEVAPGRRLPAGARRDGRLDSRGRRRPARRPPVAAIGAGLRRAARHPDGGSGARHVTRVTSWRWRAHQTRCRAKLLLTVPSATVGRAGSAGWTTCATWSGKS